MLEIAPRTTRIFGLLMEPPKNYNPKASNVFKINFYDFKYLKNFRVI